MDRDGCGTIEAALATAIANGATHFTLKKESLFDEATKQWHWDIYEGDPWKGIAIPKPWSYRFLWLGWGPNPNKLWGCLPFCFTHDYWWIAVFGYAKTYGCSCGWTDADHLADDLNTSLAVLLCDKEGAVGCDTCSRLAQCDTGQEAILEGTA